MSACTVEARIYFALRWTRGTSVPPNSEHLCKSFPVNAGKKNIQLLPWVSAVSRKKKQNASTIEVIKNVPSTVNSATLYERQSLSELNFVYFLNRL
jgi:hypothetical protein